MSQEEDPELKDLITKCLESNGILGKIRAQLRSSTYLALEQSEDPTVKLPSGNQKIQQFVSSNDGVVVLSLVRELLSFLSLDFTLSVFDPESSANSLYVPLSRVALASELFMDTMSKDEPILLSIIRKFSNEKSGLGHKQGEETFIEKNSEDELKVSVNENVAEKKEDEYNEDFQSSATDTPKENDKTPESSKPQSYTVEDIEEELDVPSEVLNSQSSNNDNNDNETADVSVSQTSLNADHSETL